MTKRIITLLISICIAIGLHSCKEKTESTLLLEGMHDEVMAIHDEVMPEISTIRKLKKKINNKLKKEGLDDLSKDMCITADKNLDVAEESMMQWMADFKKPDYTQVEASKAFYTKEMDNIQRVKDLMINSINEASKIIE